MSQVTVKELDELTRQLSLKEKLKAELAALTTSVNKDIMLLESKCTQHLKELDRTEYRSEFGELKIKEMWSVKMPENDIEKTSFFNWLRERKIFDKYATVNSRSLNSLFKVEWEQAKKEGNVNFSLPGIPAPKVFEKTDFKPKKEVIKHGTNESNANPITGPDADEIPF